MAIYLSTLGVDIGYGVETTAGTKPTVFTLIEGSKTIPDFNQEPESIEVTPLSETKYRQYVPGLSDPGGALAFGFNLSQELIDIWDGVIVPAYETAASGGLRMWFEIVVPGLDDGFFFVGEPSSLGLPAMGVSEALETDVYITPVEVIGYDTKIALT